MAPFPPPPAADDSDDDELLRHNPWLHLVPRPCQEFVEYEELEQQEERARLAVPVALPRTPAAGDGTAPSP